MQQPRLVCILCGAYILRVVGSSAPDAHPSSRPASVAPSSPNLDEISSLPMLQLVGLNLASWGSIQQTKPSRGPSGARGLLRRQPLVETAEAPLLSLMSLGLDSFGSKDMNWSAQTTAIASTVSNAAEDQLVPFAHVFASVSSLFGHREFEKQSMGLLLESGSVHRVMKIGVVIAVMVGLVFILCYLYELSNEESSLCDDLHSGPRLATLSNVQDVHRNFATVEFSDGSWAQVYREARGEQKEALELLFRCNIISTDEFAFSSVSEEHIQECLWIGTHMLRQKPLEEWVALWQQAQQTFEDNVTASFEARSGPLLSSLPGGGSRLGAVPLSGCSNRLSAPVGDYVDEDDPYTTRSHYSPNSPQDFDLRAPDSRNSQNTATSGDGSRWSIESELNKGLALHSPNK